MKIKRIAPLLITLTMLLQNTLVFADTNTPPVVTPTATVTKLNEVATGSIIIGGKVYDLGYANDEKNLSNISAEIVSGGEIYVRDFSGNWIDNNTGKIVDSIIIPVKEELSITATVKPTSFGASVTVTSNETGAIKYQVLDGVNAISAISDLGATTTVFPGKVVGDKVTIKLFNAAGTVVGTTDVVLTIKFNNDKESESTVKTSVKDTSGILVTSKVAKIQFDSIITKTEINTATFKYKVLDKNGTDITKTVPVSEISAITSVSSSISLDPLTGTGTITFNSSSDIDKLYVVTLVDNVTGIVAIKSSKDLEVINNNDTKDSSIINNSDTENLHVIYIDTGKLTKTGSSTATFKYTILNKSNIDITKTIPASRIDATASVSSTIALDPSTATGTITYNSSTDVDKEINISLVDKVTGSTVFSTMSTAVIVPSESIRKGTKVSEIIMTSTQLAIASNGFGYATYRVCDEYGIDVTSSSLSNTVTFKSEAGTISARSGILTLTPNADISFSTLNSVVITGSDSVTGVSMSATLIVNNIK